ncbi:MAG: tetratricopeptide repeat protein [bacterium]
MYCNNCEAERPDSHRYCFVCGGALQEDKSNENLWAVVDFVSRGHSDQNLAALRQFADQHLDNSYAQKILGNVLFHKGSLVEAESRYRMAIEIEPENIELIYDLSIVLYYQTRLSEAATYLEKLLALNPEYSAAHYRVGLTYYHLGRYDEAAEHFKKCTLLTPDYIMAHYHLGVVYSKMGKLEEAIDEFNHQLDKNLKDSASRHHLEELFVRRWKKEADQNARSTG